MKSPLIVLLAVVMTVVLVRRYATYRSPSALVLAIFWILLGATSLTGQRWLFLPTAVALGVGLYMQFSVTGQATGIRRSQQVDKERKRAEWLAEVRAEHAAEEPAREPPKPSVPKAVPQEGFTTVRATVEKEVVFPTEDGLELVLSPGEIEMGLRARVDPERSTSEEVSVARFEWQVADADGTVWCADMWWFPWKLNEPWHDGWAPPKVSEFRSWGDAPAEWVEAMKNHCFLVEGEGSLVDSREVLRPVISGVEREIFTKYQGPRVDAAAIPSSNRVVVRVQGLVHRYTEVGWNQPESEELEAFAYEMRSEDFLPTHEPAFFWVEWKEWLDRYEDRDAEKTPFTFTRQPDSAEPQALVHTRRV